MSPAQITPLALEQFGHDPWWIILIKTVAIFVILVLLTLFNIWCGAARRGPDAAPHRPQRARARSACSSRSPTA